MSNAVFTNDKKSVRLTDSVSLRKTASMPNEPKERVTLTLRLKTEAERDEFKEVADLEGFSTVSAWIMYHLRAQVRKTLADNQDSDSTRK